MHFFASMALICHISIVFSDPGALERNTLSKDEVGKYRTEIIDFESNGLRVCTHCNCYKPDRTHHCRQCNRCIERMDHFCPWVNNCVGRYNQKHFVLFLVYVLLGELVAVFLFVARGIQCIRTKSACEDPLRPYGTLIGLIVCIVGVFFVIFVASMVCDQYEAIRDNISVVDRLQNHARGKQSLYENLKAVFGEDFCIYWFIPTLRGEISRYRRHKEW